ncbi:MAG: Ig-like domain-containing protein, partial [Clostridiales bacterium]|nr:Ig-like domain-containing protein [Clostridiales bacterium]
MRRKLTALFTALFLALTTVGAAAELRVIQTGEEVPLGENPYLFDTPLTGQVAIEMRFQVPAGFTEHRLTLADSAGNTLNAIGQQPERSGALLFFDSTYLRLGFVTGGNPLAFFAHRNAKHTVTAVIDFSAPSARKPVRFFVDGQWIDRHVTNAGVLLPVELWSALNDLKRVEVTSSALSDGWLESVKVYPAVVADWQPMAPASSTPADGARGVSEDARITLTFHNEINAAVLNESGFSVTANGVPSEVRRVFAEDGGKTAVLELGERLAFNTEYTVTYSGITDIHGFADEAASGGFSFTTRDGYVKAEGLGVYDSGGAEVTDPVAGTVEGRATVTNYSETGDKSVSLALALYEEQNGVARLSDIASSPLQTLARGESAILRVPLHITEPSGKTLRLYLERDADARTTVTDGGFFTLSREGQSFRITGTANANEPIEIEVFKGTELPAALSRANTAYFARTEADGAGAFAFAFGFADGDSTGEYLFRVKTENTIYQRRFSYVTDEDARNTANLLANGTAADVLDLLKNNAAARFALAAEGFFLAEFSALGNGAQTYIAERFTAAPPYGFAECAALLNTLTAYEDIAAAASAEKFAKYREIFNLPLYGDYASAANVQGNIDAYVNRRSPFRQEGGETARERLANAFTEGVAVELLNAAVSGTIAEVISKYNDILRLNTAGAFSALSPADQTKAVNALIGGAFTSPADAREQF